MRPLDPSGVRRTVPCTGRVNVDHPQFLAQQASGFLRLLGEPYLPETVLLVIHIASSATNGRVPYMLPFKANRPGLLAVPKATSRRWQPVAPKGCCETRTALLG